MTPETFEQICQEIETTHNGVFKICRDFKINSSLFYHFMNTNEKYRLRYARAKEAQIEIRMEEKREILNQMPPVDQFGKMDAAFVAWQKNRVEDIKWDAAKLKSKKYGDKIQQEIAGADGSPLTLVLNMPAKNPVDVGE